MKRSRSPLRQSFAECVASISTIARRILFCGLPYILLHTTLIALLLPDAIRNSPSYAYALFFPQVEALICSFSILIGGAAIFDILDKRCT